MVCKAWSKQAVRVIWRDLHCIDPLLKLVRCPILTFRTRRNLLDASSGVEFENWERLRSYGSHVHTLLHSETPDVNPVEVYRTIMEATIGRSTILPNLHTIRLTLENPSSALGLNIVCVSSVMNLELDMSRSSRSTALSILFNLRGGRIHNIRELALKLPRGMFVHATEDILAILLAELSKLRSLQLPPFFLSEKIMTVLGSHKELQCLTQYPLCDYKIAYDPQGCELRFDRGSFKALKSLHLSVDLSQASERFRSSTAPRTLTKICVCAGRIITRAILKSFLDALTSCNRGLRVVFLNLFTENGAQNIEVLLFDDLSPLLQVALTELAIGYQHPLSYTGNDIATMVQSWPNMRCLCLNEAPVYDKETGPPPGLDPVHLKFFTEFQKLEELGVFLRIHGDFKTIQARSGSRFPKLRTLMVGTSTISKDTSTDEVAIFIAYLMSNKDMKISRDLSEIFPTVDFQDEANDRWDEVSRLMTTYYICQKNLQHDMEDTIKGLTRETEGRIQWEQRCSALEVDLKAQQQLVNDLKLRQQELERELAELKACGQHPTHS
ncbi:hypothetical protein FRC02_003994 [Tulasnella sp. 418]|nr:hypothetical protein FRC02_003994 [Tulasnella sp. 418]